MSDNYANRGTDCPNVVHDWPLPTRYIAARQAAEARLLHQWDNRDCPDCGRYGWIPSDMRPVETAPLYEPYQEEAP